MAVLFLLQLLLSSGICGFCYCVIFFFSKLFLLPCSLLLFAINKQKCCYRCQSHLGPFVVAVVVVKTFGKSSVGNRRAAAACCFHLEYILLNLATWLAQANNKSITVFYHCFNYYTAIKRPDHPIGFQLGDQQAHIASCSNLKSSLNDSCCLFLFGLNTVVWQIFINDFLLLSNLAVKHTFKYDYTYLFIYVFNTATAEKAAPFDHQLSSD